MTTVFQGVESDWPSLLFVCLLGNLFSIPEKSYRFLRWLHSLAADLRNTRKRDSYHPWPGVTSKCPTCVMRCIVDSFILMSSKFACPLCALVV